MADEGWEAYASHSPFSDPGRFAGQLAEAPDSVADICTFVQGLLMNMYEAHLYDVEVPSGDRPNTDIEHIGELIEKILAIDPAPLGQPRDPQKRLIVCCRQFAALACSILRTKGRPARTRAGMADYLRPGMWFGHAACEYWRPADGARVRFDPQIDDRQREALGVRLDVLDLPAENFLAGAEAWRAYRAGRLDPEKVDGGAANLRNVVLLDLLEINKLETHHYRPPLMDHSAVAATDDEAELLDRIAAEIVARQDSFAALRELYASDVRLQIPDGETVR